MAYRNKFMRLAISGSLYTAEGWSFGLTMVHTGSGTDDAPSIMPAGILTAIETYWDNGVKASQHASLTLVKYNEIGTDGKYTHTGDTVMHEYTTPRAGSENANTLPQQALTVSLRTARNRGRAHAGRYYLPSGLFPGTDGRLGSSGQIDAVQNTTNFLNALNAVSPYWNAGVVSNLGAGAEEIITHARVGRVFDTMRSRRTKLAEDYVDGAALAI